MNYIVWQYMATAREAGDFGISLPISCRADFAEQTSLVSARFCCLAVLANATSPPEGSCRRSLTGPTNPGAGACPYPGTLSAFSLPSFAGGIAGVPWGLPLGFHGSFPRCLLSEFRIASLLLGFQRGLTSYNLGDLRSGYPRTSRRRRTPLPAKRRR
jgi:hypothetical protein